MIKFFAFTQCESGKSFVKQKCFLNFKFIKTIVSNQFDCIIPVTAGVKFVTKTLLDLDNLHSKFKTKFQFTPSVIMLYFKASKTQILGSSTIHWLLNVFVHETP